MGVVATATVVAEQFVDFRGGVGRVFILTPATATGMVGIELLLLLAFEAEEVVEVALPVPEATLSSCCRLAVNG